MTPPPPFLFFQSTDGESDAGPRSRGGAAAEEPSTRVGLLGTLGSEDDVPSDPRRYRVVRVCCVYGFIRHAGPLTVLRRCCTAVSYFG